MENNYYQDTEDIAMAVQHKRTKDAAIELVKKAWDGIVDEVHSYSEGEIKEVFHNLIKNIQNLAQ